MRTLTSILSLSLALSVSAIQVTTPNQQSGWTSTGTNVLAWNRVDTDPTSFTVVLTNTDRNALPVNDQILIASVDATSQSSISLVSPPGGLPTGGNFRVNLVKDPNDVNTIFAQSDGFTIKAGSSSSPGPGLSTVSVSSSGTTSSPSSSSSSSSTSTSTSISGTLATVPSSSISMTSGVVSVPADGAPAASPTDLNPTTPPSNGALPRNVEYGLLGAMLLLGVVFA